MQLLWTQNNNASPSRGSSASFSNNDTAGFSPTGTLLATTGNSYASYMLGSVSSASMTNNNLGLRWDIYRPYREQYDRFSFLDPNLPNPLAGGRPGALVYGGYGPTSCNCRATINTHYRDFELRIGIAYSLA